MKIVHVFWGLSFGGIETMLVNIANAQINEGAKVSIIIINDLIEETLLNAFESQINIYKLNRKVNSKNIDFILKLNFLLNKIKPDVIHLHRSELIEFILGRKKSHEVSLTLHALPIGLVRHKGWLYRLFPILNVFRSKGNVTSIDKISKVFSISQSVKDALKNEYGIDSIVINNGILTKKFKTRTNKKYKDVLKIVQVSRLEHDKKGQDLLIEVVSKLKGKVDVSFIGDGSSMDYLKTLTKEKNVEEFVHFLGKKNQDYIANNLCNYDLFVQASRWEGFGLTVAEAMAANVPVLVSTGQGPAEVTCGDKYGWLFENGNADDMAKQISNIMNNYDIVLNKAVEARQHAIDTYDVSVTARKYLDLYV